MAFDTGGEKEPTVNPSLGKNLRITAAANQGGRRYMEDRIHIEVVRTPSGRIDYTFLAIYDGHGGAEASHFTKLNLLRNIQRQVEFNSDKDDEFLEAIRKGFLRTHYLMKNVVEEWPRTASGYPSTAGTTASVAFIRRGKIFTGHVGDSAIVLGRRIYKKNGESESPSLVMQSCRLTIDHKPESVEEEKRIRDAGGEVISKNGVMRVVWERTMRGNFGPVKRHYPTERIPFLAVARSLGDLWSWNERTQKYCVSPEPDLDVHVLDKDDMCIILASDGLTNVMTPLLSSVVVDMCEQFTDETKDSRMRLHRPAHKNHARMLLKQALTSWRNLRADNISVITAVFDGVGTCLIGNEPCVVKSLSKDESLDAKLTKCPETMIYVGPLNNMRLKTEYVPIIYQGALDNNADCLNFSGPGFVSHNDEMVREADVEAQLEEVRLWKEKIQSEHKVEAAEPFDLFSDPPPCPVLREDKIENSKKEEKISVTTPNKLIEIPPRVTRSAKRSHVDNGAQKKTTDPVSKKKFKYFCQDHGIQCDKAKNANDAYEEKKRASATSSKCNVVENDDSEALGTDEEEAISHDDAKPSSSSIFITPTKRSNENTMLNVGEEDYLKVVSKVSPRTTRSAKRTPKTPIVPESSHSTIANRPLRTPKRRFNGSAPALSKSENLENGSIEVHICVEQDNSGVVTRSRERSATVGSTSTTVTLSLRSTTPENNESNVAQGFYTPASRLIMSADRRSSRKRARLPSPSGVTPLVRNVALQTPKTKNAADGIQRSMEIQEMEKEEGEDDNTIESGIHAISKSEPTTPVKSPAFVSRLPPSRWSLGKLDPSARGEPPSKKSRSVWGFLKRLVGVNDSG